LSYNIAIKEFTKEMKKDYTILVPDMLPIHFNLLRSVFIKHGYKMEVLNNKGNSVVNEGLKYVHNDTCYPALLVIGQFIDVLNSGKYDINKVALMITQTGGGCRASNYIHLLRKALVKSGYEFVPVISLNASNIESNSGFKFTLPMILESVAVVAYGDILMLLRNQVKPYEVNKGESEDLVLQWVERLSANFLETKVISKRLVKDNLNEIAASFSKIQRVEDKKVKVGIVGEIYVKYSHLGNNNLEQFLYEEECEVMVPGLLGFLMYCVENGVIDSQLYGGGFIKSKVNRSINYYLGSIENMINDAAKSNGFLAPSSFTHLKTLGEDVIGLGSKMGEGWLLPAEILELIESGYENVICTQPFGCLPNHIIGKGLFRKIKEKNHAANIVPIDYDPSATKVNQENRIKLMLAVARENLEGKSNHQRLSPIPVENILNEEELVKIEATN